MPRGDWTSQQTILALHSKGFTLIELMQRENINGYYISQLEQAISKALNIPLEELWPCWHGKDDECS